MSEWLQIETAPKGENDTILLCHFTHIEDYPTSITVGFWGHIDAWAEAPRQGWCDWCAGMDDDDYWTEFTPTHWQPLPEPPK